MICKGFFLPTYAITYKFCFLLMYFNATKPEFLPTLNLHPHKPDGTRVVFWMYKYMKSFWTYKKVHTNELLLNIHS